MKSLNVVDVPFRALTPDTNLISARVILKQLNPLTNQASIVHKGHCHAVLSDASLCIL